MALIKDIENWPLVIRSLAIHQEYAPTHSGMLSGGPSLTFDDPRRRRHESFVIRCRWEPTQSRIERVVIGLYSIAGRAKAVVSGDGAPRALLGTCSVSRVIDQSQGGEQQARFEKLAKSTLAVAHRPPCEARGAMALVIDSQNIS